MTTIFQDTFQTNLVADAIEDNFRRQVNGAHFSFANPRIPSGPKLLHFSPVLGQTLGLGTEYLKSDDFLSLVSGRKITPGTSPYSMCYGGHQFGHWAGQLGDGRAINLGQIVHDDKSWILQLKGAGETPYSRSADGLAVLRSSVREHLCSEAMFHLGVPTTRSLSLSLTGDEVLRDVMYDGNPAYEKGAVVCRVSPSFLRFGNFEIFSARKDVNNLKLLADYTIKYFFPSVEQHDDNKYIQFFQKVVARTLDMIVHWQRVGFVHGVMNTDNLSILGLTIDYGPYGWLEGFDNDWTPNTTDEQNRRYRYGNQPSVALWNLYQLANAFFPLINDVKPLEEALDKFKADFIIKRYKMMKSKLGLSGHISGDENLINQLETILALSECDITIFYRLLANIFNTDSEEDALHKISSSFYKPEEIQSRTKSQWLTWFKSYLERIKNQKNSNEERKSKMNKVNPKYVLRNYMAQLAIDAADKGDYSLIGELYTMLKLPYEEQPEYNKWFAKRPEWARHKVGCSMLSCSS